MAKLPIFVAALSLSLSAAFACEGAKHSAAGGQGKPAQSQAIASPAEDDGHCARGAKEAKAGAGEAAAADKAKGSEATAKSGDAKAGEGTGRAHADCDKAACPKHTTGKAAPENTAAPTTDI